MIASNIDGSVSGGSSQLLDLLTLVANPDAYAAKVQALEQMIATNKKLVEAVAPAEDVLILREKVRVELEANKEATAEAKAKAAELLSKAKEDAASILADAKAKADALISEAEQVNKAANAAILVTKAAEDAAKSAEAEAKKSASYAKGQATIAQNEAKAAKEAFAEAEALKADIISKHKAFIESL
jgi:hypothetical protein